jgi:hypothetical protein
MIPFQEMRQRTLKIQTMALMIADNPPTVQ